jgi:hypothetical protein
VRIRRTFPVGEDSHKLTTFSLKYDSNGDLTLGKSRQVRYYDTLDRVTGEVSRGVSGCEETVICFHQIPTEHRSIEIRICLSILSLSLKKRLIDINKAK